MRVRIARQQPPSNTSINPCWDHVNGFVWHSKHQPCCQISLSRGLAAIQHSLPSNDLCILLIAYVDDNAARDEQYTPTNPPPVHLFIQLSAMAVIILISPRPGDIQVIQGLPRYGLYPPPLKENENGAETFSQDAVYSYCRGFGAPILGHGR